MIVATIEHLKRMIQRARLERALLLERLEQHANALVSANEIESPPESPLYSEPAEKVPEKRKEPAKRTPVARDPSLPKRPQNAYIIFCEAQRDRIRAELESADPDGKHDLNKVLNERWKLMGQQGRNEYQELYKQDRIRYAKEMALVPSSGLTATVQKEKQRAASFLKKVLAGDQEDEVGQKRKRNSAEDESDFASDDGDDVTEDEDIRVKMESADSPEQPAKKQSLENPTEAETQPDSSPSKVATPLVPIQPAPTKESQPAPVQKPLDSAESQEPAETPKAVNPVAAPQSTE